MDIEKDGGQRRGARQQCSLVSGAHTHAAKVLWASWRPKKLEGPTLILEEPAVSCRTTTCLNSPKEEMPVSQDLGRPMHAFFWKGSQ